MTGKDTVVDALSDYPDYVPPKFPLDGCPCERYATCKECIEAQTHKRTVFDDVVDAHEAAPLRRFSINELLDELLGREGVKEFSSTIETDWLVEIINCDRTDDGSIIEHGSGVARILVVK